MILFLINNLLSKCVVSHIPANFKMQASKIKKKKSGNFLRFPKILNGHKIRTINYIVLQYSGFTSHKEKKKEKKKKKKVKFWRSSE